MKTPILFLLTIVFMTACSSTKQLSYLSNLDINQETQFFPYDMPGYPLQYRDILYIDIQILNTEGRLENILHSNTNLSQSSNQNESSQYLIGFNVDESGSITIPALGKISVEGKTLSQVKNIIQTKTDSIFKHAFVDVKLLSFKYTVLGEVKNPGTYINYNNYLNVLEAIGRAGGVGDFGRRDDVIVIRPTKGGSNIIRLNLQDKKLLTSQGYFLMPNDIVIIEPAKHKIFNLNLPTISLTLSGITSVLTTTLLLINFFSK